MNPFGGSNDEGEHLGQFVAFGVDAVVHLFGDIVRLISSQHIVSLASFMDIFTTTPSSGLEAVVGH